MAKDSQLLIMLAIVALCVSIYFVFLRTPLNPQMQPIIPTTWKTVATEGGAIHLPYPHIVRFGDGANWVYKEMKEGSCTVAEFGRDPMVGTVKHCDFLVPRYL